MTINFEEFTEIYEQTHAYDNITIRYTKEKIKDKIAQTIHKEIKLYQKDNTFYIKVIERNEADRKKKIILPKIELTEASLQAEHAYIATLFSALKPIPSTKKSAWKEFKNTDSKLKWLVRYFLLDTRLIGGAIGHIIAAVANSENKHYKTIPSSVLGETLGPLIFPAGSKKPMVNQKTQPGIITIDSILHKQYKALRNYNPIYQTNDKAIINFEPTFVPMMLCGKETKLETITASNNLVTPENKHENLTILYFNGNSGCFQQDYKRVAEDLLSYEKEGTPTTAVQFNYPGILNSEGNVEIAQELIDAGIAQVQSLLDQGIPHSKIILHGVSLGGSIASHVAAHFHRLPKENNPEEKQTLGGLYASRTFASTAQVGRNFFNRALGDNIFSRFISTLCLPFIKLGTWGSNWDLDTGKAFFSLPRERRNYSVVLSPHANRKQYRQKHKGNIGKQFANFLLRHQDNPADDAILKRGLHDSWEKQYEGFLIKCGYYGKEAKKNYSAENSYRKMMVVDFKKKKLAPNIDGHAKAFYCYKKDNLFINPDKEDKAIGIVHRGRARIVMKDGVKKRALTMNGNEAGEVARRCMLGMSRI